MVIYFTLIQQLGWSAYEFGNWAGCWASFVMQTKQPWGRRNMDTKMQKKMNPHFLLNFAQENCFLIPCSLLPRGECLLLLSSSHFLLFLTPYPQPEISVSADKTARSHLYVAIKLLLLGGWFLAPGSQSGFADSSDYLRLNFEA